MTQNTRLDITFTKELSKEIDEVINIGMYSSRSEFLREATRDKLTQIHKDIIFRKELVQRLHKSLGEGKQLGIKEQTKAEVEKVKEDIAKEIAKRMGWKEFL